MEKKRMMLLAVSIVAIVGAILVIERPWDDRGCDTLTPTGDGDGRAAPDLCAATAWVQGDPTTLQEYQEDGEIVLVDFWTYSCINCIRTLPHLTAWYDTYEPYGFTIIGVHSPEFAFEKDPDNVQAAIDRHGIRYPVVQDNDHTIWDNYQNRFWPAKYLVDPSGRIVYTHFGEGHYAETESIIRGLLEAKGADLPPPVEDGVLDTPHAGRLTRELYLGYGRQDDTIANHDAYQPEEEVTYELVDDPIPDRAYLGGTWFHGKEALTSVENGELVLRYRAAAANFVADGTGCIEVYLDGAPITADDAGRDVDLSGETPCIHVSGARSYDFYAGDVEEHVLHLVFPDDIELYTFAFSGSVQE